MAGSLSILEMGGGSDDTPPKNICFDLTTDEIQKYKIGQEVTVTITGVIGMLSVSPYDGSDPEMGLKISNRTIKTTGNDQAAGIEKLASGGPSSIGDDDY